MSFTPSPFGENAAGVARNAPSVRSTVTSTDAVTGVTWPTGIAETTSL